MTKYSISVDQGVVGYTVEGNIFRAILTLLKERKATIKIRTINDRSNA